MSIFSRMFGPDPKRIDPATGKTPLHEAAQSGDLDAAKSLLNRGADIDAISSRNGATPLHYAAESGRTEVARYLIDHHANLEAKAAIRQLDIRTRESRIQGQGNTPLIFAAGKGRTEIVKLLLEHGAKPNAPNNVGATALFMAAQNGQKDAVRLLIEAKANPDVEDNKGAVALHVAAQHGFTEIVRMLLSAGAAPDLTTNAKGDTPLHDAALYGHKEIVALLLEKGAKPDRPERQGNTPVHLAAYGGFPEIVELILGCGVPVDAKNEAGLTPAEMACTDPKANPAAKEKILSLLAGGKRTPIAPRVAEAAVQNDSASAPIVTGAQDSPSEFLGLLSPEEKSGVSNQDTVIYETVIGAKQGGYTGVNFLNTDPASPNLEQVWSLLWKLSIPELERLAESVRTTTRGDEAAKMDLSKATEIYSKASELNPYDDVPLMSRGVCLAQQGQIRDGIKCLEQALRVNPRSERAKRNLAAIKSFL